MNCGERHCQLLPFCEYVFAPDKSPVEMQPEILDILLRKVYAVYVDRRAGFCSCVNVTWTDLDSLSLFYIYLTILELRLGWFAVSVKQCLGHCPWLVLQYRRES
jgi:hypothetical protein